MPHRDRVLTHKAILTSIWGAGSATQGEYLRVFVGHRFSVNSKLEKFKPRDPSNHLDGLWQYIYPSRPTT